MNNDIKDFGRQVGHDCATFLPYPDDTSDFNLIVSIKYFELPLLENSILAVAGIVGLYNTEEDKSAMFEHSYPVQLVLSRDGLDYDKFFEQNYQNQDVVDKVLKQLASVFNDHYDEIQDDLVLAVKDIMEK